MYDGRADHEDRARGAGPGGERVEPWVVHAPARASATGTVLVVGAAVVHEDGRRTCSSLVVDRDGQVTAAYDKQNLWGPDERALFTPGTRGATLALDGWELALGICYDGCFPEHGRAAAESGADGYLLSLIHI